MKTDGTESVALGAPVEATRESPAQRDAPNAEVPPAAFGAMATPVSPETWLARADIWARICSPYWTVFAGPFQDRFLNSVRLVVGPWIGENAWVYTDGRDVIEILAVPETVLTIADIEAILITEGIVGYVHEGAILPIAARELVCRVLDELLNPMVATGTGSHPCMPDRRIGFPQRVVHTNVASFEKRRNACCSAAQLEALQWQPLYPALA